MVNNKEWLILRIFLLATILSFLLTIGFIHYWQSTGAAWAIVLTETMVLVSFLFFSKGLFHLNKKFILEIILVLAVFPIAYLVYSLTHKYIESIVFQVIIGTGLTLLIHIPVQLLLFKSRFWINVKKAIKAGKSRY